MMKRTLALTLLSCFARGDLPYYSLNRTVFCLFILILMPVQSGLANGLSPDEINGHFGCVTISISDAIHIPNSPAIYNATFHPYSIAECMARWNVGEPIRESNSHLSDGWLWDTQFGCLKLNNNTASTITIGFDADYSTAIKADIVVSADSISVSEYTYAHFPNTKPLSNMSYEEASQTIEAAIRMMMTESWNAVATPDVSVRPLHAEDLQAGRDELLADEFFGEYWVRAEWNGETIDTSHYTDKDECYHALIRFRIDDIPVLADSYYYEYNDVDIIGAYAFGYINSEKILSLLTSLPYDLTVFKCPSTSLISPAQVLNQLCSFLNMLLYEDTYTISDMDLIYYPIPQRGHRFQFRPAWRVCLNIAGDRLAESGIDNYSKNIIFDGYTGEILAGL